MTIETEVQNLTTQVTALIGEVDGLNDNVSSLLGSVNVQKSYLTGAVATASASVASSSANAAAAQAANATAQSAVGTSVASAQTAAAARDAAIAAWAAGSAPTDVLAASSLTLYDPIATIKQIVVYDTTKDSDGGLWRKRCQATSWFNEPLASGKWLGIYANEAAAITAGGVSGDFYQSSTTSLFYQIGSGTEIYRGNVREFPAIVALVVEDSRLVIFDLTQANAPMWMVFKLMPGATGLMQSYGINCAAALNGQIYLGASSLSSVESLRVLNFIDDSAYTYANNAAHYSTYAGRNGKWPHGLGQRHSSTLANTGDVATAPVIAGALVSWIAAIVMPGAPIDTLSGLPRQIVACATNAGISILRTDGNIVNSASAASYRYVGLRSDDTLFADRGAATTPMYVARGFSGAAGGWTLGTPYDFPWQLAGTASCVGKFNMLAIGSAKGAAIIVDNAASYTKSLRAAIGNDAISGWMAGDIKGAWMGSTVAGALGNSGERLTNGDFAALTGWQQFATGSPSMSINGSGQAVCNSGTASNVLLSQAITTVVGETYMFEFDRITASSAMAYVGNTLGSNGVYSGAAQAAIGRTTAYFTATSTTTYVSIVGSGASSTGTFDNATVRRCEPDQSSRRAGIQIVGSLTKTAVAAGAGLCAYSGWSASNYLQQPYDSALDFGTGDFSIMGWVILSSLATQQSLFHRATLNNAGGIHILAVATTGIVQVYLSASVTFSLKLSSTRAIAVNVPTLVEVSRLNGVLSIKLNGVVCGSIAELTNVTYPNAITRIGYRADNTLPVTGSMALWRVSASGLTDDQSEYVYRTERQLFNANVQCALSGPSPNVSALDYDDETELLHVGTANGYRSSFSGLVRVDNEFVNNGQFAGVTSIGAAGGAVAIACTNGARYSKPAQSLRSEIVRGVENSAVAPEPFWFTGTGSAAAFTLPLGYQPRSVYKQGMLMRDGTGNDYTYVHDGFRWTVTFVDTPINSNNICIMGARNV